MPRVSGRGGEVHPRHQRRGAFLALGIAVHEVIGPVPGQEGEFHQLLHHVDDPVIKRRGAHPPGLVEFLKRLRHRGLVRDRQQPHPSPENAHLIDRVEALRAARDLDQRQRLALCRPHRALGKRDPVDLRLHQPGHRAMALGARPDHALAPGHQLAQLAHLRVARIGAVIDQRQAGGGEEPHLGAETDEDAPGLLGGKAREAARPQRAVQQQDARRVRRGRGGEEPVAVDAGEQGVVDVGGLGRGFRQGVSLLHQGSSFRPPGPAGRSTAHSGTPVARRRHSCREPVPGAVGDGDERQHHRHLDQHADHGR
ncbi:hypothetical protein SDC9_26380 [bioreactor metagenome]|uniref:Uncharacterized protein n=1 Tax=bioreactor metagenome TaxID=1076179 RepID=A0A644UNB6_9ZZZZ